MKKLLKWAAPLALGVCVCGMLKADDAPPGASSASTATPANSYIWWVEHTAAVAKDADASGVQAVIEAKDLLRSRDPQASIDFFNKELYAVKSRPVQRAIRMALYDTYREHGQNDQALDQLQKLMMDQ